MEDLRPSVENLREEYREAQLVLRGLDLEIFSLQQRRHAVLAQCAALLTSIEIIEHGYR